MEIELLVWQISLIAMVAGLLIGAMGYRYFAPSKKHAEEVQSELDKAREELNQYKADVSQHFDRTAELVNDLAQNYVNVYQHLADGAQTLGASKSFNELYGQGQGNPAIGLDDRSDAAQEMDSSAAQATDKDTSMTSDEEHADSRQTPVDYAVESNASTVDEDIDSGDLKQEAAEPAVSESIDDSADAGQTTQDSEARKKS